MVFGRFRRSVNVPEPAVRRVDEGDDLALSGTDGPTAAEEVDLVIGISAAAEVKGQMEVEQAGVGSRSRPLPVERRCPAKRCEGI